MLTEEFTVLAGQPAAAGPDPNRPTPAGGGI
jgi:hypothetical protein